MTGALHISISAEPITTFGSLVITNSIITSLIVSGLLIAFALAVKLNLSSDSGKISPLQNFAEFLIESLYGLIHGVTNDHTKTRRFMPLIVAFFVFIILNNWLGLVPGVGTIGITEHEDGKKEVTMLRETITTPSLQAQASTKTESPGVSSAVSTASEGAHQDDPAHTAEESGAEAHAKEASHAKFVPIFRPGTADINTTVALGFITMLSVQVWGVSYLGLSYFKKFFNFANPMTFFVGILELISDISKILSFAFRLFGNIFAGEVLLVVMTALVPLVVPMVFYGLEVFVGAIQALVFSLLSLVFYQMATVSHEEHN